MSAFWSGWIIFFVVLNWSLVTFLVIYAIRVPIPTAEDGTTGHVWAHGTIREGVRQLPKWWMAMSVLFIVFAVVYLSRYPGFGHFKGSLDWTSAGEVAQAQARNDERQADMNARIQAQSITALAGDPQVVRAGGVLFGDNCAACHGEKARGNQAVGAPNLTDDAWLYGGDDDTLHETLVEGRQGAMPALGAALGEDGTRAVAAYVYQLNGRESPHPELVAAGKERFQTYCTACHGPEGKGNPAMGAANLTDDDWLYGGSLETIITTLENGRSGQMPAWNERLGPRDIKAVAAWVRAQGDSEISASASTQ